MKFLDYIQGFRKGTDANEIEQESLTDPFLFDAIDGYDSIEGSHCDNIADMQSKVREENLPSKSKRIWRIFAAAIAFFAVISSYFYLSNENNYTNLVSYITSTPERVYTDSQTQIAADMTQQKENVDKTEKIEESIPSVNFTPPIITNDEELRTQMSNDAYTKADLDESKNKQLEQSTERIEAEVVTGDVSSVSLADIQSSDEAVSLALSVNKKEQAKVAERDKSQIMSDEVVPQSPSRNISGKIANGDMFASKSKNNSSLEKEKKTKFTSKTTGADWFVGAGAGASMYLGSDANHARLYDRQIVVTKDAIADDIPKPIIGKKSYKKYLKSNIKYPKAGSCAGKKGIVVLQLSVSKEGRPVDIKVTKSLCAELDREAIRLVKMGSAWTYSDKKATVVVEFEAQKKDK